MRHRQQPRGGLVLTSLKYFSEKSLAALKLERRNKVEDFKRKTNYYETRELLERYEDGQRDSTGPVARPIDGPSSRLQPQQLPVTPQRAVPAVPPNTPANIRTSISPTLQSQLIRRSFACSYSFDASNALTFPTQRLRSNPFPPRKSFGMTSLLMRFSEKMSRR